MGIIRKTASVSTLGLVDFRSDKERTAAYTKAAKKEAKKQTRLMEGQAEAAAGAAAALPTGEPPSWLADPTGRHEHRWWDGTAWTTKVADAGVQADEADTPPPPPAG